MAAVITVSNSEGEIGRCDAKCHNARHPTCVCICGGANHGVGLQRAIKNTQVMLEDELERHGLSLAKLMEKPTDGLVVNTPPVQRPLF